MNFSVVPWYFWLVGAVAVVGVSFGAGYYKATSQAETRLSAAVADAYGAGTKAQKNFDDGQFAKARADFVARQKANQASDSKLAAAKKEAPTLVPQVDACTISAAAMHKLNEVVQ